MSEEDLKKAVETSTTIAGVLRSLGRAIVGSNYKYVKKEVSRLGLSTSHWKGQSHGTTVSPQKASIESVLVENSSYSRDLAKRIVVREKLLPYECAECKLVDWRGNPLVLRLDHKNGVRDDHRLSNLQYLCPNCDSQTITFCGRNKRGTYKEGAHSKICSCGKRTYIRSNLCLRCENARRRAS